MRKDKKAVISYNLYIISRVFIFDNQFYKIQL